MEIGEGRMPNGRSLRASTRFGVRGRHFQAFEVRHSGFGVRHLRGAESPHGSRHACPLAANRSSADFGPHEPEP